ncbi:hypothetical protein [Phenylobacterium sp.]|jgi:hypothetical protein|uniref:hypothetical protein n=1 Tax=Phenylobacterium sp. TaxID=1871053 RepID=UPI002F3E211F
MANSMHTADRSPDAPHGPVVSEFDAKQGRQGYQILVVLLTSLALVVIAFGALYLFSARPFTTPALPQPKTPSPVTTP